MNIIDVILKNLLNQIEYNIMHIPSKFSFFNLSSSFLSRFNKIFYSGFNNYFVSLFIFLQIVWKKNFHFNFLSI